MLANFSFPVNGTFHKIILSIKTADYHFVGNFTKNTHFRQDIPWNQPQYKLIFPENTEIIRSAAALSILRGMRKNVQENALGSPFLPAPYCFSSTTVTPSSPSAPRGRPRGDPRLYFTCAGGMNPPLRQDVRLRQTCLYAAKRRVRRGFLCGGHFPSADYCFNSTTVTPSSPSP